MTWAAVDNTSSVNALRLAMLQRLQGFLQYLLRRHFVQSPFNNHWSVIGGVGL